MEVGTTHGAPFQFGYLRAQSDMSGRVIDDPQHILWDDDITSLRSES